jgi:hypothetical protein
MHTVQCKMYHHIPDITYSTRYLHFLPSRSEIRFSEIKFTKCFRRELDRPLYQVPDGTCPTKGFFGDTKVLGDAFQDAKRKRATRKAAAIGVAEFCGPADDP